MKALYYIAELIFVFIVDICISAPFQLTMRFINFILYKQNQKDHDNNRNQKTSS